MKLVRAVLMGTLLLNLFGCGGSSTPGSVSSPEKHGQGVIYGDDSVRDVSAEMLNLGSSFALVSRESWELFKESGETDFINEIYATGSELEWGEQSHLAFCSGVLMKSDVVLTAGHCITDEHTCENTVFVRNYRKNVPASEMEVFNCKKVSHRRHDFANGLDYAVVKLTETVNAAAAQPDMVALREGAEIYSLGYPLGSPLKKADGKIRSAYANNGMMISELDVFEGNSGSPIYSKDRNKLIGILSSGENDFNDPTFGDAPTDVSVRHCLENECLGEFITPIEKILADIENQL
ncbi:serine protease [Bdellovibrio bacteriovorus]|uniref:trypsin-like serine peptidase n=1 Tax=Bdellovibrio bacteriovorus TaxID=959 RepID=UPI0021D04C03|nr:serine protease [Bdellovibrio bacteriovorus]UXR65239.1 serine protease [Bdellovibrio bacteriovorus]